MIFVILLYLVYYGVILMQIPCFINGIVLVVFLKYFDFVQLDPEVKESFDVAYDNIYAFHVAQKLPEKIIENMKVFYIFFLVYSI
jgi:hypothetical protein